MLEAKGTLKVLCSPTTCTSQNHVNVCESHLHPKKDRGKESMNSQTEAQRR